MSLLHFSEGHRSVAALFGFAFKSGQRLVDGLQVSEDEFGLNRRHVAFGIHTSIDVDDVIVFKNADDFTDGIGLTDGGQELVAESFAFAGAAHDAGDVDKVDGGRQDALGTEDLGENRQSRVGDRDHAHVWFDRGEGVVRRQNVVLGESVKEGGLAHIGKSDDAN